MKEKNSVRLHQFPLGYHVLDYLLAMLFVSDELSTDLT